MGGLPCATIGKGIGWFKMTDSGLDQISGRPDARTDRRQDVGGDEYAKPIPDILSQIKDSYSELRPAERRVADVVLADVNFSVDASNAEIPKRAAVSEPTGTRFSRATG